ncbi:MAG: response regulator [Methanoregula sp.]
MFLEESGEFSVDTAISATTISGCEKLLPYDAVVADYEMPEINGIEFLKRVREAKNPILFILFTGRGREDVVIQALNEGADFYLQKGADPVAQFAELIHMIRTAIARRRADDALRQSEANLKAIIENTNDIIASYDTEIRLRVYNHAFSEVYRNIFGVELQPGMRTLDLFPESQRGFWTDANARALAGESFSIEFEIPENDRVGIFESFFNPIRKDNRVVGFSTVTRDITRRREHGNGPEKS